MARLDGAFTVTAISEGKLIAFRDPHGFRPLALASLDGDPVVASESCAFDLVGADFVREIAPGELVVIDEDGVHAQQAVAPAGPGKFCIFEFFYLARPDSTIDGVEIHGARVRMGEQLAREAPVEADLVMAIPDSGTPAAIGYSRQSGIPYNEGLIKNRYVGRTFIQPEQGMREQGIRVKYNPLTDVAGKAGRRRGRLDRAREHHAPDRLDPLRGRRDRGARPHLLAADRLTVLLRHRLRRRGAADRVRPVDRGGAPPDWRDLARLPLARWAPGVDAAVRGRPSAAPASRASIRPAFPRAGRSRR